MKNREQIINDLMYECFFVASRNLKRSFKNIKAYSNDNIVSYEKTLIVLNNIKNNIHDNVFMIKKIYDTIIKVSGRIPYKDDIARFVSFYKNTNDNANFFYDILENDVFKVMKNPGNQENNSIVYSKVLDITKEIQAALDYLEMIMMDKKSIHKKNEFNQLKKNIVSQYQRFVLASLKIKKYI